TSTSPQSAALQSQGNQRGRKQRGQDQRRTRSSPGAGHFHLHQQVQTHRRVYQRGQAVPDPGQGQFLQHEKRPRQGNRSRRQKPGIQQREVRGGPLGP